MRRPLSVAALTLALCPLACSQPDVSPIGFSCPTERRLYCDPDMTMCHSERDVFWSTEPCTRPADANLPNLAPRPVFRCEDSTHGVWYSWAPCDQEPDPIEVF